MSGRKSRGCSSESDSKDFSQRREREFHSNDYYYHYTSKEGLKGIKESGIIRRSELSGGDAAYGAGTYLTERPPCTADKNLLKSNYGTTSMANAHKTDRYVQIHKDHLPCAIKTAGKNVVVEHDIDLSQVPHKTGAR